MVNVMKCFVLVRVRPQNHSVRLRKILWLMIKTSILCDRYDVSYAVGLIVRLLMVDSHSKPFK